MLNLFFVIVLKMTVNGVATATVVSNFLSALLLFVKLVKSKQNICIRKEEFRFDRKVFLRIMQIGLPSGIQSAVFGAANIVIQSAINSLGTIVMAASSAAFNIEVCVYDIMNSFSQACTTFVGQNYGAGNLKHCKKILLLCILEDAVATASMIIIVLFFGKNLLRIFSTDYQVINTGYIRLLMIFAAYTFSMLYENMSGYLRGFGISFMPALFTVIGICGVRLLWMATVFPKSKTFKKIMMAYPLSLSFTAVLIFILLIMFRPSNRFAKTMNNKKKEKIVIQKREKGDE